jgi:hypothetical protein
MAHVQPGSRSRVILTLEEDEARAVAEALGQNFSTLRPPAGAVLAELQRHGLHLPITCGCGSSHGSCP